MNAYGTQIKTHRGRNILGEKDTEKHGRGTKIQPFYAFPLISKQTYHIKLLKPENNGQELGLKISPVVAAYCLTRAEGIDTRCLGGVLE